MSFSALFGKSGAAVDKTVDALFKKSAKAVDQSRLVRTRTEVRPERAQKESESEADSDSDSNSDSESDSDDEAPEAEARPRTPKDASDDLEARYFTKLLASTPLAKQARDAEAAVKAAADSGEAADSDEAGEAAAADSAGGPSDSSDSETEAAPPRAARQIDLKESELEKAERTVFVGNVAATVITSKPTYKRFKQVFERFGKVTLVRFRSISFDEAVPRKMAFAKKALHAARDTVNAYVVFEAREASRAAARALNATVFEHNHLRTDHVGHPAPRDNKRTIFVGNLDFEEKEEVLWRYFQAHTNKDVELVRIIRDAKTNVGKGFALVQFKDTLLVNKALMLADKPILAASKRKLRITRASTKAQPSLMSPNHIDNTKRAYAASRLKLNDLQRTKLGRATTILGRADRATAGQARVLEGQRATKGGAIVGIKGLKGARVKKPRLRERSTKFKEARSEAVAEAIKEQRAAPGEAPRDTRGSDRSEGGRGGRGGSGRGGRGGRGGSGRGGSSRGRGGRGGSGRGR